MKIIKILETKKVIDHIYDYQLENQYKKAKNNILSGINSKVFLKKGSQNEVEFFISG